MMAVQDFQPVIDRFEDDVLALAYYIKDRDVICGEYKFAKSIYYTVYMASSLVGAQELGLTIKAWLRCPNNEVLSEVRF